MLNPKVQEKIQKAEEKTDSFLTKLVSSSHTVYLAGAFAAFAILVLVVVLYLAWK